MIKCRSCSSKNITNYRPLISVVGFEKARRNAFKCLDCGYKWICNFSFGEGFYKLSSKEQIKLIEKLENQEYIRVQKNRLKCH